MLCIALSLARDRLSLSRSPKKRVDFTLYWSRGEGGLSYAYWYRGLGILLHPNWLDRVHWHIRVTLHSAYIAVRARASERVRRRGGVRSCT